MVKEYDIWGLHGRSGQWVCLDIGYTYDAASGVLSDLQKVAERAEGKMVYLGDFEAYVKADKFDAFAMRESK